MAKNLIPEIARMLGVEIGEEFKVKGREYIFHFVNNGLIAYRTDGSVLPYENCLTHFLWLINGEEEIVKIPWKPKKGEDYYTFEGWAFHTREEAESALPKVAAEMGVKFI